MTGRDGIEFELPGLDDVLKAEIDIARMDVTRMEIQSEATRAELTRTNTEIAALKAEFLRLRARRDEFTIRASTERRVLKHRRQILFDLEQETGR